MIHSTVRLLVLCLLPTLPCSQQSNAAPKLLSDSPPTEPASYEPSLSMIEYDRAIWEEAVWSLANDDFTSRGFRVGNVGMFLMLLIPEKFSARGRDEVNSEDYEFSRDGKPTAAWEVIQLWLRDRERSETLAALWEHPDLDTSGSPAAIAWERLQNEARLDYIRSAMLVRFSIANGDGLWTRYEYFQWLEMWMSFGSYDSAKPLLRWERIAANAEAPGVLEYLPALKLSTVDDLPGTVGPLEVGSYVRVEEVEGSHREGVLGGGNEESILISGAIVSRKCIQSVEWLDQEASLMILEDLTAKEQKAQEELKRKLEALEQEEQQGIEAANDGLDLKSRSELSQEFERLREIRSEELRQEEQQKRDTLGVEADGETPDNGGSQ